VESDGFVGSFMGNVYRRGSDLVRQARNRQETRVPGGFHAASVGLDCETLITEHSKGDRVAAFQSNAPL
jgi:hypothetical protein